MRERRDRECSLRLHQQLHFWLGGYGLAWVSQNSTATTEIYPEQLGKGIDQYAEF